MTMQAARFVLTRKLFTKKADGSFAVRRDAFLPRGVPLETSVILHDRANRADIPWAVGEKLAAGAKPDAKGNRRTLRGCADLSDATVAKARLTLKPQPSKISKRHANIIGWTNEKVEQQDAAQTLAENADVYVVADMQEAAR